MIHTPQRMLAQIRYQTNHSEDEFSGSSAVEMMYLDSAQDFVFDRMSDMRPEILSSSFNLTLNGSSQYYIPDSIPFDYEQILLVEDYTDSDSPYSTTSTDWLDRMRYFEQQIQTSHIVWSVRDNYLEFPEKPSNATARVWYTRRPVGMFYGTCGATVSSTTVTLPSSPTAGEVIAENDYYNGMKIYFGGQVRTITDFVGSSLLATVSPAWSTNPTASTSTIELISPLPGRLHDLIVQVATRKIRMANDDDDTAIKRFIDESITNILQRLSQPQRQGPVLVKKVSRF